MLGCISLILANSFAAHRPPTTTVRTRKDVALLLALMFKYSCEECVVMLFDSQDGGVATIPELEDGTILHNMAKACLPAVPTNSTVWFWLRWY